MDLDKHHHNETKHKNQGQMPADQTHPMPMNLCSKKHAKKSIESMSFVEKLYDILSDPENMHIICWMPHGRSWKILCNDLLAREVCPKYFNHSNFASFNRQVNGWGFKVRVANLLFSWIEVGCGVFAAARIFYCFLSTYHA